MILKKIIFTSLFFLASLFFMRFMVAMTTACPPISVGDLSIGHRWVRASTGPNTAAYLTITNTSGQPDKLISVDCPQAGRVELHDHINEDGIMKMRPVESIVIGKDPVTLKPGSLHIMLMEIKSPFQEKETVPLTLHFEKAGDLKIDFPIKKQE